MTMIVAMPDDNDNIYIFKQDFQPTGVSNAFNWGRKIDDFAILSTDSVHGHVAFRAIQRNTFWTDT